MKGAFKGLEESLDGSKLRVAIIVSRYNDEITTRMLGGATEAMKKHAVPEDKVMVMSVPGAFELPLAAMHVAETQNYDAIVCLGVVIRGATPHFDYVCSETSRGIMNVQLTTGVPIGFGVLTLETADQGMERTEPSGDNKGLEAAEAALEMALHVKKITS